MSMREEADVIAYRAAMESGATRPLHLEPSVREYASWRIIENRFPHTKISRVNHMLVPKREAAFVDITTEEWQEFLQIVQEIWHDYDNILYNFPSMSTVKNIFHCHLYQLKPEYK